MPAVGCSQHGPATCREHPARNQRQLINDQFLDITKTGFPFALKEVTDRATDALLDDVVGVEERKLQPSGELTPDGGFAGAGEAYKRENLDTP